MRKLFNKKILIIIVLSLIAAISIIGFAIKDSWAGGGSAGAGNGCIGGCTINSAWPVWKGMDVMTPGEAASYLPHLYDNSIPGRLNDLYWGAVNNCKARNHGVCTNPHIVQIGYINTNVGVVFNSSRLLGFGVDCIGWNIEGNPLTCDTALSNGDTIRSLANIQNGKTLAIVVVGKEDLKRGGWYPVYEPKTFDAYTSTVRVDSHELDPCPYEYRMRAEGLDGYVWKWKLNPTIYKTEYGKLYDKIASGETKVDPDFNYNPGNAQNEGAYAGSYYAGDLESKNAELLAEYQRTCKLAYQQIDNWDMSKTSGEDNSGKTITGTDFINNYVKGGLYKVIRERRDAQINYKSTEVEYYHAKGTYYVFKGWEKCLEGSVHNDGRGNMVQCSHINEPNPPAALPDDTKPNLPSNLADWDRITYQEAKDAAEYYDEGHPGHGPFNFKPGQKIEPPKDIRIYDYGYRDVDYKFHGKSSEVGRWEIETKKEIYRQVLDHYEVTFKMKWTPADGKVQFLVYGFPSPNIDQMIRPVKQSQQSWKHVWHQDFLNVLCNIKDFEAYKAALEKLGMKKGSVDDNQNDFEVIEANKYQAQMKSAIIDSDYARSHWGAEVSQIAGELQGKWSAPQSYETDGPASHGKYNDYWIPDFEKLAADMVAGNHEPFDRFIKMVTLKQVVGSSTTAEERTKKMEGQLKTVNSEYTRDCFISDKFSGIGAQGCGIEDSWYESSDYKAKLDPVYTKECPWDCTSAADYSKTGSASVKNNVRDGKTNASSDAGALKTNAKDVADNNIGVRIRPSDVKGGMPSDSSQMANSSNMTFFRNNAWNNFNVDIYVPIIKENLDVNDGNKDPGDGSDTVKTSTAKTTTIVKNNGTPWYIAARKPESGFATHMESLGTDIMSTATKAKLFDSEDKTLSVGQLANQISKKTDDPIAVKSDDRNDDNTAYTEKLAGEHTAFRIKSNWATDSNIGNLKFNMKWEYDVKNNVTVSTNYAATGAHSRKNIDDVATKITGTNKYYAVSDGNCYAQQSTTNALGNYPDMTDIYHDNTGAGVPDDLDNRYHDLGDTNTGDKIGHFTIQFVRASAE